MDGGLLVVFGGFVDINEGLASWAVGSVWFLAIGAFEDSVGAGLACGLAGGAYVLASVVVTSTQLAFGLLPANCGMVSIALAGIALAVGLGVAVGCTTCLYSSNQ